MKETKEQWMKRMEGQQAAKYEITPYYPPLTEEQRLEYYRGLENFELYDPDKI